MVPERFTVEIDGEEGRLTPKSFIAVLRAAVDLLNELQGKAADEGDDDTPNSVWVIESLEKTNPGLVTLISEVDRGIASKAIDLLRTVNEGPKRPDFASYKALQYAKRIVDPIDHGVRAIHIRNGKSSVTPTQHVAANIDEILGARYYTTETSIEGRLDLIDIRGKLKISIEDEASGRDVRCDCPPDFLEKTRDLFNQRVTVFGEVKYSRETDEPVSITVQEVDKIGTCDVPFSPDHS